MGLSDSGVLCDHQPAAPHPRGRRQAPVVEGGALAVGTVMTVTLSADHRVMDGALAARLLAAIVERVESPVLALA